MTILGKDVLADQGPYIKFCIFDAPLDIEDHDRYACPSRSEYEHGIFFEFADNLLGALCSVTRSYSPFDPHGFIQFKNPYGIYEFSSKLLMWEYQLSIMPENYFRMELEYFVVQSTEKDEYSGQNLKSDLLETLHFLIGKFHQAASAEKCVAIVGI